MPRSRQLAAIMFTDIVGYTALMGEDEQKAFEILDKNRKLQKPLIEQNGGRWIKELGDGVLACFNTVSDAVNAAIKIQESCNVSKEFLLRIGIHHGEVVVEENDIFGDTVNIAFRIQSLAPIGGIWISESVHNNVSNKKGIKTTFVRTETLKNVKEPVRIYEVARNDSETNRFKFNNQKPAKAMQNKGIAVLPFVNMSSDPEQEFFSDGLTEDIITDLSHLEKLLVISRSSMMTFKGTNKKIKEIATEVNVQYILEGSVRKVGNNLRITAQLIDAVNDVHLWAERYNGLVDDVFDIQEKVSRSIVEALNLKLTVKEDSDLSSRPIQNARAYEYYILARQAMWKRTEQKLEDAITFAQRGIDLVGDSDLLYGIMSTAYLYFSHFAIRTDAFYEEKAYEYATKSLALNPNSVQAYFTLAEIEHKKGNIQQAVNKFKKILQLDPNHTDAMVWLMVAYIIAGRPEAAIPISERLIQVDPLSMYGYQMQGDIKFYSGQIKESLPHFRWWLQKDPDTPFVRCLCSWNFALNGELKECFDVLDSIIRDTPTLIYGKIALFLKTALQGHKDKALNYATKEMRHEAETFGLNFPLLLAWGYALIDEKDESVRWLNKSIEFGFTPYPLLLKWETLQRALGDHPGFQAYMEEIKKRSEEFVV